jgi:hypothetical protein
VTSFPASAIALFKPLRDVVSASHDDRHLFAITKINNNGIERWTPLRLSTGRWTTCTDRIHSHDEAKSSRSLPHAHWYRNAALVSTLANRYIGSMSHVVPHSLL